MLPHKNLSRPENKKCTDLTFPIKLNPLQNHGLTNLQNHGYNDTWIEHWWKSDSPISREFLCVQFLVNARGVLVDPQWTEVQRAAVERLVGPVEEIQRA